MDHIILTTEKFRTLKFNELNLHPSLLEGIEAMGFETPTPIQEKVIPELLEERKDMIAVAQTGTGKTAAYLIPALHDLAKHPMDSIHTLIIAPTRELALQIDQQLEGFAYFTNSSSQAVYGGGDGSSWEFEKKSLTQGADFIIATPGRLISHLNMGYVKFESLKYLILDEADRMLDMGFWEDIRKIIGFLPEGFKTLMFSATMPPKIKTMAEELLHDPVEISIAISKPAEGILQAAYMVYEDQKIELVKHLLKGRDLKSVLIFSKTKRSVDSITKSLKQHDFDVEAIHSDLDQSARESTLLRFRSRQLPILVATDVLSRGIDIEGIDLVLNFDVPQDAEDYVHRVGRTARGRGTGVAVTFITEEDQYLFYRIEQLIESEVRKLIMPVHMDEGPEYNPKDFKQKSFSHKGGSGGYKKKQQGGRPAQKRPQANRSKNERPPAKKGYLQAYREKMSRLKGGADGASNQDSDTKRSPRSNDVQNRSNEKRHTPYSNGARSREAGNRSYSQERNYKANRDNKSSKGDNGNYERPYNRDRYNRDRGHTQD